MKSACKKLTKTFVFPLPSSKRKAPRKTRPKRTSKYKPRKKIYKKPFVRYNKKSYRYRPKPRKIYNKKKYIKKKNPAKNKKRLHLFQVWTKRALR